MLCLDGYELKMVPLPNHNYHCLCLNHHQQLVNVSHELLQDGGSQAKMLMFVVAIRTAIIFIITAIFTINKHQSHCKLSYPPSECLELRTELCSSMLSYQMRVSSLVLVKSYIFYEIYQHCELSCAV